MQLILFPMLIIWGIIKSIQKKELRKWLKAMAIGIDRFGNCVGKYTFNDLLGEGFGNSKETISYRLGMNEQQKTYKTIGKFLIQILNKLDNNHCKKAIDNN